MISLEEDIRRIANDRTSGSVSLVNQLILVIKKTSNESLTDSEKNALKEFSNRRPTFVVLSHFVSEVMNCGSSLQAFLREYESRWASIQSKLIKEAYSIMGPHVSYLLHSHSETVVEYFKYVQQNGDVANIYQTISLPDEEGRIQAARIGELGFQVEVITDDPPSPVFDRVNTFLCGADVFAEDVFVNKVGTKNLAAKARNAAKEVVVLADPRKKIDDKNQYQLIKTQLIPSFEEIPMALVTNFIDGS